MLPERFLPSGAAHAGGLASLGQPVPGPLGWWGVGIRVLSKFRKGFQHTGKAEAH